MDEYKKSKAFEDDATKAKENAFVFNFNENHPRLDLSDIITDGATPKKEGEEERAVAKEESARAKELVAKGLEPEVATTEGPEESTIMLEKEA